MEAKRRRPSSKDDGRFSGNFSRHCPTSLHQPELVHAKCSEWLSSMAAGVSGRAGGSSTSIQVASPAIGDVTDVGSSVTTKLLTMYNTLVLPEVSMITITIGFAFTISARSAAALMG